MAIRPLNSVAGFSVGETPANIILANGDITTTNITLTGVSNLNSVSNVKITGGSSGQVIQTDGAGNLSFVTISTSSLTNGSSNINVTSSGNILFSVAGAANVGVFTSTGLNVAGYITATGNITALNANLGNAATANYFIGAGNNLSNIQGANVSGTVANANYSAYAGNVTGSSQGNITSVGTLTALDVSATVNAQAFSSNVATGTAPLSVLSTTKVTNLNADFLDGFDSSQSNTANTVAVRDVSGNISATYFIGDGSQLTGIDTSKISNGNSNVSIPAANGNVNITAVGNTTVVVTGTGANITGYANVSGNVSAGGVKTDNLYYANGTPWDLQQPAGSNNEIQFNDNGSFGANANLTFDSANTKLTVGPNTNIYGDYVIVGQTPVRANLSKSSVNFSNNLSYTTVSQTDGFIKYNSTTGYYAELDSTKLRLSNDLTNFTFFAAYYGNGDVLASGNLVANTLTANANVTAPQLISNVATGTAPLNVLSTTRVGNLNVANAGYADDAGNATSATNASAVLNNVRSTGTYYPAFISSTSNGNYALNSNTAFSANLANGSFVATTFEGNLVGTTANLSGNANVGNLGATQILATANITAPQLISNIADGTAPLVVTSTTRVANLNVATAGNADAATNAASVLNNVITSGTVYPTFISSTANGNYSLTSNTAYTANVANGFLGATLLGGTLTTASQPNITSVGTLSSLSVTGNIDANNLSTTNKITAGNGLTVTTGTLTVTNGNLDVTGNINVTGNLNYSNVTDLVVGDPLIYIGANNTGDLYDLGIVASYNDGTYEHTGLARNATDDVWTFFDGVVQEPTTVIDWANATYPTVKLGNLIATANANIGGYANIVGNANIGNVGAAAGVFTANVTAANIYANSGTIGASLLTGTLTTASQPNITSVGTLTSVSVTGNVTAGNVYANSGIIGAQTLKGEGGNISNIQGANVSGTVSSATTAGTVTTNAQPNITSVGTLSSLSVTGNVSSGNISATSANITTANVSGNVLLGNTTVTTTITWASVTTSSTSSNQTIASLPVSGVTGVEYLVKAVDSTGSKYSVASVIAVTDGSNVDYSTYGTVQLGGYTGSLAVNIVGTDIRLQVTPASSNSTVWTTQYRLI